MKNNHLNKFDILSLFTKKKYFGKKHFMYIFLIVHFLLVIQIISSAQCYTKNTSFTFGENITYGVFYNWHFIWLNTGDVYFRVDSSSRQGNKLYHFISSGTTHKKYDWFFKVRDSFEVYVDSASFQPLRFFRKTYEGGYEVDNKYFFDHENKEILSVTKNSKKPLSYDTLKLPECTFDVLTTIYYARNIDYSKYNIDDKIPLSTIIDNEIFELHIKYLGKETITLHNGRKFRCIKFKPLLVEGTIFRGGENMTVWVTDDKNKVPVMIEAKILVGSIKAIVNSMEGLRHVPDAEILD